METERSEHQQAEPVREILEAIASALGEVPAGQLSESVVHCRLTNQFGDCVAAFAVEARTRARTRIPTGPASVERATRSGAFRETDLECVENIPV